MASIGSSRRDLLATRAQCTSGDSSPDGGHRRRSPAGEATPEANPNGSLENVAGICNARGNVVGLMPHPERAADLLLGSADGARLLASVGEALGAC